MESDIENGQIKKILLILDRAKSPAPLDYISFHTGIKEPLEILEKMEEEKGLVRRSLPSCWSCSMDPMYEITPKTKKELCSILF
ncbi:MAG: hypothetical protein H3Z53_01540 [archaeon]|nr:hypothetical protein [archaeon]MCP8316588.1 hypothetical protein [archaeon]MCP8319609.1 hypothetical protein [archaeon]